MPIMDSQLIFSESQDMATTSGVTISSTNIVYLPQVKDHTETSRNDRPGVNMDNCLNIVVEDEAFVGSGAVLGFGLYADSDSGTVVADGDLILQSNITLGSAGLPDGTQIACLPLPVTTFKPFLQLGMTATTASVTAGFITAWIGPPIQQGGDLGAL